MDSYSSDNGVAKPDFKRFEIPVIMGVIIGIASCVLSTLNFKVFLTANFFLFSGFFLIQFLVSAVLYGITGARQRKAMGGYINIKDAFQATFVAILISTLIASVWGIIYARWIDPGVTERVKMETLAFMEKMKVPEDKMTEATENIDAQLAEGLNPGTLLYNYAKGLILYSIIGFICAAIVKRNPPVEMR